jgi:hypothetical protein
MNYTEAMQEASKGKKITREAWLEACFLRAEKFEYLAVTEEELAQLKKQIFVSVIHRETMEMRFLFFYCGKHKELYQYDKASANANDWEIYQGDQP